MADDDAPIAPGDDAHQPLPPETAVPDAEFEPDDSGDEWVPLRDPAPSAAEAALLADAGDRPASDGPSDRDTPPAPGVHEDLAAGASNSPPTGSDWWRGDDVRDELRTDWHETSSETKAAMQEVGHQAVQAADAIGALGDAVAGAVYPAAKDRGLDIRWMHLSVNIPAIAVALLVTYAGRSSTDRMVDFIAENGVLAPLGVLLLPVGVIALLAVIPIGTPLAGLLAGVVQGAARGVMYLLRYGWRVPYLGYLLRLAVAIFCWAFCFGVITVAGRSILRWLTGV